MYDYEIERDIEDGSEYYYSVCREAFYWWQEPGKTLIELTDLITGKRITGYIQQGEKADGICRDWMERGDYTTDSWGNPTYWWLEARRFAERRR